MAAFHGHGDELQLTFNFPAIFADFTAGALSGVVAETLAALPAGECPVWTASNHDISRFPTRWCGGDEAKSRLALLVLATLPGTFVLYYGDEIAMTDVNIPAGGSRDEISAGVAARTVRDRARTPMPWDASPTGGFTAPGVRPWLPIGEHAERNVARQRDDPASTLRFCRELLALRRAEFGGTIAAYMQLPGPPGVWVYRVGGVVVAANFAGEPACLGELTGPLLLSTSRAAAGAAGAGPGRATAAGSLGGCDRPRRRRGHLSPVAGRDGHPQGGLVGERDRELPERGRVERRRVALALDVGLAGTELVPGEVGLRREETEVGGPPGKDRVERGEPRGEGGELGRGEAGGPQAALLGPERVVVLVDDHPGVTGQDGELAEQLQVILAERGQLLLEKGGGRLVIAARGDRAVTDHQGPANIVGADVDDDHRRVRGSLRRGQLRGK